MSLAPEQAASFGAIIDLILAKSDLNSISSKQIRKELAERLGYDVSDHKDAIKDLIGVRFDKAISAANGTTNGTQEPPPSANGVVKSIEPTAAPTSQSLVSSDAPPVKRSAPSDEDESELSEPIEAPVPKKRKRVPEASAEDDDAAYAARLQAELNSLSRPTRGGATKKRAPVKKEKRKKKSAARIKGEGESDGQSDEAENKQRTGGFHKVMTLSQPLSDLLGETELSRPQTVKRIWAYVKARDLQDPKDKRWLLCDDAMRGVFKSEKVHMFTMNKILAQNLYAQDE